MKYAILGAVLFTVLSVWMEARGATPAGITTVPDGYGGRTPIQVFSPNGKLDQSLTAASTTIDMRNRTAWGLYVPADCKFRNMSTASKAVTSGRGLLRTVIGGDRVVYGMDRHTPFVNFTGCSNGEVSIMGDK